MQLRNRIAPFVLRRHKFEVLREPPARTEITLRVEPSYGVGIDQDGDPVAATTT